MSRVLSERFLEVDLRPIYITMATWYLPFLAFVLQFCVFDLVTGTGWLIDFDEYDDADDYDYEPEKGQLMSFYLIFSIIL